MADFPVVRLLEGGDVLVVLDAKANTGLGAPISVPVLLEGRPARLFFRDGGKQRVAIGADANLYLGGNETDGDVVLFSGNTTVPVKEGATAKATVHIDGGSPSIILRSTTGEQRVELGGDANLYLGWNSNDGGDIVLFGSKVSFTKDVSKANVHLDGAKADLWLGGNGSSGDIMLFKGDAKDNHDSSQASIRLNGFEGDIVLSNADCAEEFEEFDDPSELVSGAVVALSEKGGICLARQPYDRRVAGVVSGAGGLRPAIVLGRQPQAKPRWPVALSGKVFCHADASYGPIKVGDLLTTSATPGYAMVAQDPGRSFGAVLGKAIAPLSDGAGLIPVLVALQ